MIEIHIDKDKFQHKFLFSEARYPAIIAGVGVGKTLLGLLKVWKSCEKYPNSLWMVVRKQYSDLRDSTLKDMKRYFGVEFNADKEYKFDNGSVIMARHGDELDVLRNVNLSGFLIEQAEEFETEETFTFLRDRLRRETSPLRQGLIIANARGHNWVWRLWINGSKAVTIDQETGQHEFKRDEFHAVTANTFANQGHLPADFIADLKRMEVDQPHHFAQYVMNSFEEVEEDDLVFTFSELMAAKKIDFAPRPGYGKRIFGFDLARYGNDKCAAVGIEQIGSLHWRECHVEQWGGKDLEHSTGRIVNIAKQYNADASVMDIDGLGCGPFDSISVGQRRNDFHPFSNHAYAYEKNQQYLNPRTRWVFKLKEMISKGFLQLKDEALIQELSTLRFRYESNGRIGLVSKDVMKSKFGIASPNLADCLIMTMSLLESVQDEQANAYRRRMMPMESPEDNLFRIAGVR